MWNELVLILVVSNNLCLIYMGYTCKQICSDVNVSTSDINCHHKIVQFQDMLHLSCTKVSMWGSVVNAQWFVWGEKNKYDFAWRLLVKPFGITEPNHKYHYSTIVTDSNQMCKSDWLHWHANPYFKTIPLLNNSATVFATGNWSLQKNKYLLKKNGWWKTIQW